MSNSEESFSSSDVDTSEISTDSESDQSEASHVTATNIELLEHQRTVIKYLVSRCRTQHGLLVNHFMGTGKTNLAVFFQKNFPNERKCLICPAALQTMWKSTTKHFGLKVDNIISFESIQESYEDYNEKNYNDLASKIKGSIMVVDEAHNLIKILNRVKPSVFTMKTEKEKKQYKKDISIYTTFVQMLNSSKKTLLLSGSPVIKDVNEIRWLINFAAGFRAVPYLESEFVDKYYKKFDKRTMSSFTAFLQYLKFDNVDSFLFREADRQSTVRSFIDEHLNLGFDEVKTGIMKYMAEKAILKTINYYIQNYNYDSLNLVKIQHDGWGKYVSFYKYDDNAFHPTYELLNMPVLYTDYQLGLYYRLVKPDIELTDEETYNLGFFDSLASAELFRPLNLETDYFWEFRSGIIGNLGLVPNKFKEILKVYKNGLRHEKVNVPGGFKDTVSDSDSESDIDEYASTVVYSNHFQSGLMMFAKYLDQEKISYTLFTPKLSKEKQNQILDDFKNKRITLILLHPSYFEGFSINGCRVLHVLEPVTEYYKKEQLFTRAVRYSSHTHLPHNQRNVKILQWYCTLTNLSDKIRQASTLFQVSYFNLSQLQRLGGCDDAMIDKINMKATTMNALSSTLKKISIDKNTIQDTCCIFGENDCKLKRCTEHNN